jgi:demethylmenaquinone methyltransferase/2-methoxy-6-polyprenyl-1,4-benzoquinol methylase
MLAFAEKRSGRMRFRPEHRPRFLLRRAEELPVEPEPYDVVVSGFVLRNLYENIDVILRGVFRSLKPGGRISFLDITEPQNPLVRALWQFYMSTIVVLYGKAVFGRDYPLFYLTQSAHRFLNRPKFVQKLEGVGFRDVRARSFMFGVITLYQAAKPSI